MITRKSKKVPLKWKPFSFCLISIFILHALSVQSVLAQFEKPGTLSTPPPLKSKILKSEYHEVDRQVFNDGLFNQYNIKSSFGNFKANSTSALKVLVHELSAIAAMKKVETNDTMVESFKQSGGKTVDGIRNLVTDPGGTFEGAVSGVGSLFNRAKETVGRRKVTKNEDSKIEQFIGLSKAKGEIATKYGVNMYSRNKVLQEELDRLARADYLGGLGIGLATSVVSGAGGLFLTTSGTARLLNETINATPASELWLQNKNKLLAMKMNEDTVKLFLNNPAFSPAQMTVLVTALESMKGIVNRDLFITIALQASDSDMANVITATAVMTARYHKNISPLVKLASLGRLARSEKKDGTVVVVLPTDYIIWSKKVADIANFLTAQKSGDTGGQFEIWTLGDLSPLANDKLKGMGWKVHTNAGSQLK